MNTQKTTKYQIQVIGQLVIKRPSNKSSIKPCYDLRDFKDSNCYIDDLKYTGLVQECFTNAIQGKFKSLSMKRNDNQQILKEISHIQFSSLRVLQLSTNQILNIQPLGWLNAFNLRCIDLEQNLITSVKPLAKLYTNSLSELKIGRNLFSDTQTFPRMKFRVNEFYRDFSISDIYCQQRYRKTNVDVSFLAKLQEPKDLHEQWITISKKGQIKVPKFSKALLRKNTKKRAMVLSLTG